MSSAASPRREPRHEQHRERRTDERRQGTAPYAQRGCLRRDCKRDDRAQPSAARDPQDVGIGQRVAEQRLVDRPRAGERGAHERRKHDARQPHLHDQRVDHARRACRVSARPIEPITSHGATRHGAKRHACDEPREQRRREHRERDAGRDVAPRRHATCRRPADGAPRRSAAVPARPAAPDATQGCRRGRTTRPFFTAERLAEARALLELGGVAHRAHGRHVHLGVGLDELLGRVGHVARLVDDVRAAGDASTSSSMSVPEPTVKSGFWRDLDKRGHGLVAPRLPARLRRPPASCRPRVFSAPRDLTGCLPDLGDVLVEAVRASAGRPRRPSRRAPRAW